jgi:hypothetical protein
MMQKKLSFLETSPEKFRQKVGSGSYSTGCPTPTGSPTPAILQPKTDSSSPSEAPSSSQSDVISDLMRMRAEEENVDGLCDCKAKLAMYCQCPWAAIENGSSGVTDIDMLRFWDSRIPVRMKG